MKNLMLPLCLLSLLIACQRNEETKSFDSQTIVAGEIQPYGVDTSPREIFLHEKDILNDHTPLKVSKVKNGKFSFSFDLDNVKEMQLLYDENKYTIVVRPMDSVFLSIYNEGKNKQLLAVNGNTNHVNVHISEYALERIKLIRQHQLPAPGEVDFQSYLSAAEDRQVLLQNHLLEFKKRNYLQDSTFNQWTNASLCYGFVLDVMNYKIINYQKLRHVHEKARKEVRLIEYNDSFDRQYFNQILDTLNFSDRSAMQTSIFNTFHNSLMAYNNFILREDYKNQHGENLTRDKKAGVLPLNWIINNYRGKEKDLLLARHLFVRLEGAKNQTDPRAIEDINELYHQFIAEMEDQYLIDRLEAEYKELQGLSDQPIENYPTISFSEYPELEGFWKSIRNHYPDDNLYLKFWAPWCGPCMKDWPKLKSNYDQFKQVDFQLISIAISTPADNWQEIIKQKNLPGHHILLPDKLTLPIQSELQFNGLPTYMIVDKENRLLDNDALGPGEMLFEKLAFLSE